MKLLKENIKKKTLREEVEQEILDGKRSREKEYRRYANISDTEPITDETIDTYALNRTSCENNYDVHTLRKDLTESVLLEDEDDDSTVEDEADKIANQLDAEVVEDEDIMFKALDWALDANLEEIESGGRDFKNLLFVGDAGVGKTSRIEQWAAKNNINLFSVKASVMDDTDTGGAVGLNPDDPRTVIKLSPTEFDHLEKPNSVLFLDEFNRAKDSVRGTLLTLINDHKIADNRVDGGARFFPNFLFTIAAINPPTLDYNTLEMDRAERDRFREIYVPADWGVWCRWMIGELKKRLETVKNDKFKKRLEGRLAIINHLYNSKEGVNIFDSKEDMRNSSNKLITSPRSLTRLLTGCDGTKDDFLAKWNECCNSNKRKTVEIILDNYEDIDDKANDALRQGPGDIFADDEETLMDKLKKLIPELND